MSDQYSIESTHSALKQKMLDYIRTVYLGKNDDLRLACESELEKLRVLYQEPYIEANQAYKVNKNGIANLDLTEERKTIKSTLLELSKYNLGVFKDPYFHQTKALEAFAKSKDIFVATGTGSGKTECFMWPMVSKLLEEAKTSPETWEQRGVRALMLYPMNALVSDQLGRLRRMIGDKDGRFREVLHTVAPNARVPQFGMYTGRTPYAGEADSDKDKELAKTIKKDLINTEDIGTEDYIRKEKSIAELIKIGKYPAKFDLQEFVSGLTKGEHYTHLNDVELITRQEIRQNCPDILITNYSMLQYMLIRPIEECIWNSTKAWLNAAPENKLLFIIDEAHMYRGSAGGEVALLIRRFMHKLGIDRNKLQFILTSASIPKDEMDSVKKFANNLSAQDESKNTFQVFTGDKEEIEFSGAYEINPHLLQSISLDELQGDFKTKIKCLQDIACKLGWKIDAEDVSDESSFSLWIYNKLKNCAPMLRIINKCRGNATKYDKLCNEAFPNVANNVSYKATSILLSLAHLAKKKDGNVFFPSRLHLMFRGLKGIYACSNPHCSEGDAHSKAMGLGKIYLGSYKDTCKCGGKVYELINDRSCGAIFLKGYIDSEDPNTVFVWNKIGEKYNTSFREVHFYILNESTDYKKKKEYKDAWLDSVTGRLYVDDSNEGKNGFIRVAYSSNEVKGKPGIWTFSSCPKCEKRRLNLTDFITKGNEPFFNLVSEQFYVQPPTIFKPEDIEKTPNAGRKVLLFSDSRQRAAVLAKDLTRAADEDAMKKALTLAAIELQTWAQKSQKTATMDLLYVAFLKVSAENNLRFFYGEDEKTLKEDIANMQRIIRRNKGNVDFVDKKSNFKPVPKLYQEQLIKQMCSNFRSLTDAALCWIIPSHKSTIEEIEEVFEDSKIDLSVEEFSRLFSAWATEIMTDSYALGDEISDSIRSNITMYDDRLGIKETDKFPSKFSKVLNNRGFSKEKIDIIYGQLREFLSEGRDSENKYLNLEKVSLKFDVNQTWYKCPRCSSIFPFTLWDYCARCGKGVPIRMTDDDFERIRFWRDPVISTLDGSKKDLMTRINVEEHTAQLSHKDGKQKTWSTTEDFEMRFQNVYADNDKPVDVLSCTTTMEVGIDIGSLTAVGLRNVPPMRENYQQRAGRAGRRSTAISTIVTFIDNGPHDSYYFHHPEKIISGEPRKPWIDIGNKKLVFRHMNSVIISEYFRKIGDAIDNTSTVVFFKEKYTNFVMFIKEKHFSDSEIKRLLPEKISIKDYSVQKLLEELEELKDKIKKMPENYKDDDKKDKSLLDSLLEEGIFPTYSFPRNVVGFHIENKYGSEIVEKPDRSIDIALSEYAPGRIVVVNKKSYKSGGIYNFHSKFIAGKYERPAEKYFENNDFYKNLYYCKNQNCTWMNLQMPESGECPFCHEQITGIQPMIKPWGFSPQNGVAIKEAEAESENSYATDPCYAVALNEAELNNIVELKNVRYTKLPDQPLTIINSGIRGTGFTVCKLCGAIVPGNSYEYLRAVSNPYKHPRSDRKCFHPESSSENVFLGHQFLTDMIIFEIALDSKKLDTGLDNVWLTSAVQSLSEAMALSAGRMLDIEFTDIKNGYRIRYNQDIVYIDIFLFDKLSSGAGYSSAIAERAKELFDNTRETLLACKSNCDSACQECLKHFWNQRVHSMLNRKLGLSLLDWLCYGKMDEEINIEKQFEMLKPLAKLLAPENKLLQKNDKIIICGEKNKSVYVYPAMWKNTDLRIPCSSIAIPDKLLKDSLPEAYRRVLKSL